MKILFGDSCKTMCLAGEMDGGRLADPAQVAQSGDIGLPIVPGLGKNASVGALRLAEAF